MAFAQFGYHDVESLGYRVAEGCPPIILTLSGCPTGPFFGVFWFFESRLKVECAASGVVSKASASVDLKIPLSPCLPLSWLSQLTSRNWMMPRMQAKDKEDV